MTSKEAIRAVIKEFQKDFEDGEETNQWLTNVIEGLKQVEKDLDRLDTLEEDFMSLTETNFEMVSEIFKNQEILKIIKEHILDRKIDSSGIYLEYHQGHYEPYYTIEVKEGVKQVITEAEVKLLKEWLDE